jgi:hypothetical protein
MRGFVVVAAVLLLAAAPLQAQTCSGVRAGKMGELSAAMHTGGWQTDQAWRTESRGVSLRGLGGRFRVEASQSDLIRRWSEDEATGRAFSAGYTHPVVRVAQYGAIACLTAGAEFTETTVGDATVREPNIPVGIAWGIDLMPESMFSLIPHVETGVYACELDGWGGGVYTSAGVTARVSRLNVRATSKQRLRVSRPVQQFSVGFSF